MLFKFLEILHPLFVKIFERLLMLFVLNARASKLNLLPNLNMLLHLGSQLENVFI